MNNCAACPRATPGPPPGRTCLQHLSREALRRPLSQMSNPPQLPPFSVEEKQLYSEPLSSAWIPDLIFKGEASLIFVTSPSLCSPCDHWWGWGHRLTGKLTALLFHSSEHLIKECSGQLYVIGQPKLQSHTPTVLIVKYINATFQPFSLSPSILFYNSNVPNCSFSAGIGW